VRIASALLIAVALAVGLSGCEPSPALQYNLTISSTDGGTVTEPGEGVLAYDAGTVVALVATPAAGYGFLEWTGDVATIANVSAASTTITMNGDYSIKANFQRGDAIQFADANLEAAIRRAMGLPERPVYPSDLEGLTYLHASGQNILDLSGLEHCTRLTGLYLGGNHISDVSPLSALASLTRLYLGDNRISDIAPLANLTNLTEIYLYRNQISDISPLSSLANLTRLSLGYNEISDISPLANLTNLTRLYIEHNRISYIAALASLTSLTELHLGWNQISDIAPLVDNPGLGEGSWVDIRKNPLSADSIDTCIPQLEARGVHVLH